ncbi:MAG TPA: polysaccharide deacetylase family protein [Pseudobdellovibrionaceae bacterium]
MKKNIYIIIFLMSSSACTNSLHHEIRQSISANQKARSLLEWETAEENPKKVFSRLREEFKTNSKLGSTVCEELLLLKGQDLSLFEEEINNPANGALLKECIISLKKKLEEYWLLQKKPFQSSGLNFSFEPRIEKRDLSKGYRASSGDVQSKELIITFDDGPHSDYSPKILDILKSVNAKAMFFPLGPHVRGNPAIVYRAATEGHVIGSHSITHRCLADNTVCAKANGGKPLPYDQAVAEIRGGHQAVYEVLGFVDPFFRFPYGESSFQLSNFLASRQVGQFYWSIDSGDWRSQTNEELLKNTLAQVDKNQRGIVLFHDTHRRTLEILDEFLRAIYEKGYTLVVLQSTDEKARYNSQLVTKHWDIP